MSTPTLVAPGDRFALAQPHTHTIDEDTPPPYGLRFAGPCGQGPRLPEVTICPETQIAHTADGVPWYRTLVAMEMSTSGESQDGTGSTGGEEWSPDYQADSDPR